MNVFFLHAVSSFGGSTRSLYELYLQLKLHGITGSILCPSGKAADAFSNLGMKTYRALGLAQFDNTDYAHYRGLRWLILLREFFFLFPTILGLLRVKINKDQFNIIHANEITLLPVAIIAKKLFKCPLVVHVRSVQRGSSSDLRSRILFQMLHKYADSVIAIDETVQSSLPSFIHANVVHNGINLPDNMNVFREKTVSSVTQVGIVGMLTPPKGIYEFLDAARILLLEKGLKIQFVVVGENARASKGFIAWIYKKLGFSDNIMSNMIDFISRHKIENHFNIKGFIKDICAVYSELDILCFPSRTNAVGRPVFEAAFFGIPSVVAITNPKADAIIDQETGICINQPCAKAIANAIDYLVKNPEERIRLGRNAQNLAFTHFDIKENAKKVTAIYRGL